MADLTPLALRMVTRLSARYPRRLRIATAEFIARVIIWLNVRAATVTRTNLAHCFADLSEPDLQALTLASLSETAQLILESGMTFHWNQEHLDAQTACVDGTEVLEGALQSGRGVLLLVPHFGNWEFLALYLGRYRLVALYDPPRHGTIDAALKQARERTGASLLALDRQGLRQVFRTLEQGGLVGILPDQVPDRRSGVYAPFFGRPALTMTLVHRLIVKHSPVVLMGSATRTPEGFHIRFESLEEAIHDKDPQVALTTMNRAIEKLIASNPAQYQWEYKRFKAPPEGTAQIY